ncbi:MAG: glycosyltransferase [Candidatus Thermoplasmatota archaeon]|nr:glycosyltransferase [Candidatus Thermoplasmatota archaeon]
MKPQTKPFISILLTTYNRSEIIEQCVNSVLTQSYLNWELIISDDGSTDNTLEISKKIMKKDSRIRYYRNTNKQGLPMNRNIVISRSLGNLIFFIEDDLILDNFCLETLVNTFEELNLIKKVGAIAPRLLEGRKKTKVIFSEGFNYVGDSIRKKFFLPCVLDPWTGIIFRNFGIDLKDVQEVPDVHACSLYIKNALLEVNGYSGVYSGVGTCEETDTNLRIKKKGYKFYFQPKAITYHQRINSGGCSQTSSTASYYFHYIRNNILLRTRNFGWKSLFMIPNFLLFIFINTIKYSLYLTSTKIKNQ